MDKNDKGLLLALTITQIILEKGIPAMLNLIKDWEINNPTIEDIKALHLKVKDPESYFDKKSWFYIGEYNKSNI